MSDNSVGILAAELPSPPTVLTQQSANTDQITISWTPSIDNGSPISNYHLYWNNGSGTSFSELERLAGNSNDYTTYQTVSDLTDGSIYEFKLIAFNAVG